MKFLKTTKEESFKIIENATMAHLTFISNFIGSLANKIDYPVNLRGKTAYIERFQKMVKDENLKVDLYKKLCRTDISKELYDTLLWKEKSISLDMFKIKFPNIDLENDTERSYEYHLTRLTGIYALLHIKDNYNNKSIFIPERIRLILKFLLPLPEDYDIETVKELKETKYTYNNEEGILSFIPAIDDMLNNDLVAFGKTAEKPLAKTLNMLNSSTSINEFYSSKPLDKLSIDMITRSFSFYRWETDKKFKQEPQDTLKEFISLQLRDIFKYSITRTFTTHLRRIKYPESKGNQKELFNITKIIIRNIKNNDWYDFENIINFCKYNDYRFDLEESYKTTNYYIDISTQDSKSSWENKSYCNEINYNALFFEPILKAMFFYLGSLGIVELKYDEPISDYYPKPKGKIYISPWDSLKYIRLTNLGKYVFGYEKSYKAIETKIDNKNIVFNQYKPIITLEDDDTLMIEKIESFVEKYAKNKYILSHSKIFENCTNQNSLERKINHFYKNIESNPPEIFNIFFQKLKEKSSLLKMETQKVSIVLDNNKELLKLFMTNEKIKDIIIKASGYRIIVEKQDLTKLSKILKENGFFVEF